MPCLILIGIHRNESGVKLADNLYTGFDGTELLKAHADALASGKYDHRKGDKILRVNYPMGVPMAIDPKPIRQTIPVFPKQKSPEPPKVAELHPDYVKEMKPRQDIIDAERRKRLQPGDIKSLLVEKPDGKTGATIVLNPSGPTVEEWVEAGFDPRNYPPKGFAPKNTQEQINFVVEKWLKENPDPANQQQQIPQQQIQQPSTSETPATLEATAQTIQPAEANDAPATNGKGKKKNGAAN